MRQTTDCMSCLADDCTVWAPCARIHAVAWRHVYNMNNAPQILQPPGASTSWTSDALSIAYALGYAVISWTTDGEAAASGDIPTAVTTGLGGARGPGPAV